MALFDSDFLKKLEYLSLVSRRVFRGQLLAQRRTMQLGGGIEFADHREYTPGDDFRYLDWNVFARHDELLAQAVPGRRRPARLLLARLLAEHGVRRPAQVRLCPAGRGGAGVYRAGRPGPRGRGRRSPATSSPISR